MRLEFPHTPRKRFGQNFLQDAGTIQKIIQYLHPNNEEKVLEIGPGLGALTTPLLEIVNHLDVVEIDRELVARLKTIFPTSKLTVHQQDALTFDLESFTKQYPSFKKLRLIGNLPYNISTPLLFHFFKFSRLIEDMHFMLQKEVADRLSANPHQKNYGRLSIMTQYYCKVVPLFTVDSNAFYPKPKVQSVFIRLVPHSVLPNPVDDVLLFQTVIQTAFNQRRKTLANALKTYLTAEDYITLNIQPTLRPEALSLKDFIQITNFISQRLNHPIEHKFL